MDAARFQQYLGSTYRFQGNYEKAKEAFNETLALLEGFPGDKYNIGLTSLHFGHLFFDMKDFAEARRKYKEARDIFDSHGQLEKDVDYCSQALAKLDKTEAAASVSE